MRAFLPLLLAVGCAAGAPPREERTPDLVIPPLGADAGAATTAPAKPEGPIARPPSFEVAARDPRPLARFPRADDVVRAEIESLRKAYASSPTPETLHQLGDAYAELAHATGDAGARKQAIATYEELLAQFGSTYTAADEVRYYLGVEDELAHDYSRARRAYYDLIVKNPSSKLIPFAYFAFGEMFFAEATSDPSKNDLAQQAFLEVLKFQASPLAADALMRLAQTYERKHDDAKARAMWTRLRRDYPNSDAAAKAPHP